MPNNVLGTTLFVVTEIMFFTALISAYLVIRSGAGFWAPPTDVRLPIVATTLNTMILFASGIMTQLAIVAFKKDATGESAKTRWFWAILLGTFFVVFQGYEWIQLIKYGMTLTTSVFSSCFFLLIGSHALHALSAVIAMLFVFRWILKGEAQLDQLRSMQIYWYFVVSVWPFLYLLVYF